MGLSYGREVEKLEAGEVDVLAEGVLTFCCGGAAEAFFDEEEEEDAPVDFGRLDGVLPEGLPAEGLVGRGGALAAGRATE